MKAMLKFRMLIVLIAVTAIASTIRLFHCGIYSLSINLLSGNGNHSSLPSGGPTCRYDQLLPPIFVGGVQNEGVSVMFSVLCCHPNIWCIDQDSIVSQLMNLQFNSLNNVAEKQRLVEAGVSSDIMTSGLQAFLAEIMVQTGREQAQVCVHDIVSIHAHDVNELAFPNARIVAVVHDGRSFTHPSDRSKNVRNEYEVRGFHQRLMMWNSLSETLDKQCQQAGNHCQLIYYEQLVKQPEQVIRYLANFLDVRPNDGDTLNMWISKASKLIPNVTSWSDGYEHFTREIYQKESKLAPMLERFGFDVNNFPPRNDKNPRWLKFK